MQTKLGFLLQTGLVAVGLLVGAASTTHANEPPRGRWGLNGAPGVPAEKLAEKIDITLEYGPGNACSEAVVYKDGKKKGGVERGTCSFENIGPRMYRVTFTGAKGTPSQYELEIFKSGDRASLTPIKDNKRQVTKTFYLSKRA